MSNLNNDMIMEGLADEFFDDVSGSLVWMRNNGFVVDHDLPEDVLCDQFVKLSMDMMADGPQ